MPVDEERVIDGRVKTIVLPTPERAAKGDLEIEETDRGASTSRPAPVQRPIALLRPQRPRHRCPEARGCGFTSCGITAPCARATLCRYGEERAVRYAVNATPQDVETYLEMQEAYHFARKAIHGVKEKKIALTVCCHGEKAGKRGEMDYLRRALDDLTRHFGLRGAK